MPPGCGEGFPGVEDGGIIQGTPVGHPPSCQGIQLLVSLMEDPSRPPLGWLAGQLLSSRPLLTCLPHTSMSRLPVGAGLVAEESKVTLDPEVLLSGCTTCWYGVAGRPRGNGGGWCMSGATWSPHAQSGL